MASLVIGADDMKLLIHARKLHQAPKLSTFLLLTYILIPKQCPQSSSLVINNRFRIPQFLEFVFGHIVIRIMDCFSFQVFKLGYPVSNIIAVRITFLRLSDCIEDSLRGVSLF